MKTAKDLAEELLDTVTTFLTTGQNGRHSLVAYLTDQIEEAKLTWEEEAVTEYQDSQEE